MLVVLLCLLRIQLNSFSPFSPLLTPPLPYQAGRRMDIGGHIIFMVYFAPLLGYYILVGNAFSLCAIKTDFMFE